MLRLKRLQLGLLVEQELDGKTAALFLSPSEEQVLLEALASHGGQATGVDPARPHVGTTVDVRVGVGALTVAMRERGVAVTEELFGHLRARIAAAAEATAPGARVELDVSPDSSPLVVKARNANRRRQPHIAAAVEAALAALLGEGDLGAALDVDERKS